MKTKTATTSRGRLYTTSASGRKANENDGLGPQASLVFKTLQKLEPATSAQVTEAVEKSKKLETKQPVARVVGFYLAQFRSDGHVKLGAKAANGDAKPAAKPSRKSGKKLVTVPGSEAAAA